MLFKNFAVNVNWVQIDDDVIPRPSYIGAGQWLAFWEEASAIQDRGGYDDGYQVGYEDGIKESDKEHKGNIEELEDQHAREISKLEQEIESLEREIENLEEDRRNVE